MEDNVIVRKTYTVGSFEEQSHKAVPITDYESSGLHIVVVDECGLLVGIRHPHVLYFEGVVGVTCIAGEVEILGHTLLPQSGKFVAFSMRGESALGISACTGSCVSKNFNIAFLYKYGIPMLRATQIVNDVGFAGAIVYLDHHQEYINDCLKQILTKNGFHVFPTLSHSTVDASEAEIILNSRLDNDNSTKLRKFEIGTEWPGLFNRIAGASSLGKTTIDRAFKVVICGGKSVGKSSLMRYLINKTLGHHNQILVIDLDIGQTEFAIPGCVTAVIVDKPILSPNYCHLTIPHRCLYIGHVDVTKCISLYISSIKDIIEYCQKREDFRRIPWFVNTMGFSKGLGVTFIGETLNILKPTNVVQIVSKRNANNFTDLLSRRYMNHLGYGDLNYEIDVIESVAETAPGIHRFSNYTPADRRKIVILSYLYGNNHPVTYCSLNLKQVYVKFIGKPIQIDDVPISIGDLLVLTDSKNTDNTICCIGIGTVEKIEHNFEYVHIRAIISRNVSEIKGIIIGTIRVPETKIKNDGDLNGHVNHYVLSNVTHNSKKGHLFYNKA